MLGLGNNLNDLKTRIKKAQEDLAQTDSAEEPMPEMINTTNLLRANEHLVKTDQAKTNLILAYEEYTKQLENLTTSLLSIQSDLRDIVTAEASLLVDAPTKKQRKRTTKRKKPRK